MDAVVTHYLIQYEYVALFLGAVLFGEVVLLAAIFLAAEGVWSFPAVFGIFLLGTIVADVAWFIFGQRVIRFAERWDSVRERYASYLSKLDGRGDRAQFLYLLIFKFLYGTRIITIVYLSLRKMSLKKFVIFDTLGTSIWLGVLIVAGWLVWKGITGVMPALRSLQFALVVLIILAFAVNWTSKRLGQIYFKK